MKETFSLCRYVIAFCAAILPPAADLIISRLTCSGLRGYVYFAIASTLMRRHRAAHRDSPIYNLPASRYAKVSSYADVIMTSRAFSKDYTF